MTTEALDLASSPENEDTFYLPTELGESTPPDMAVEITTAEQAEYVVEQLTGLDARVAKLDARLAELTARHGAMKAKLLQEKTTLMTAWYLPLRAWAEANRPTKGKTIKLLGGNIAFKDQAAMYVIDDKDKAIAWARQHQPSLVAEETVYKLDTKAAKELCEKGVKVEGFKFRAAEETMTVKAG